MLLRLNIAISWGIFTEYQKKCQGGMTYTQKKRIENIKHKVMILY